VRHGQNGRVIRRVAPIGVLLLSLGLLAGCSDDGDDPGDGAPSPGTQTSETDGPYLPVPEGVELTEPGSDLAVGESGAIAWQPRQDLVGVLDINVTQLARTTFETSFEGWDVSKEQEKNVTPYFVRATVTNLGETNLSQRLVPLYAVDSTDTLVEPTKFTETFEPCPGGALPRGFFTDDTAEVCMVYLVGDGRELTGVTFRPTEDFEAITWTGEIEEIEKAPPPEQREKEKNEKGNRDERGD
jgi:hypothetical protein